MPEHTTRYTNVKICKQNFLCIKMQILVNQIIISLVQCFKVLLLPNFEKDLHGIAIVVHFSETREVSFNLLPVPIVHFIFKILHVKEEPRFLLKPIIRRDRLIIKHIIITQSPQQDKR